MAKKARSQKEKLLDFHEVDPQTGCWNWTRTLHKDSGYGLISSTRRYHYAHRVSYRVFIGEIADGLLVCHRCDNRRCINPEHLFLGTYQDNSNDMMKKGRQAAGERGYHAKLKVAQVLNIRTDRREYREIAAEYGVSHGLVGAIKTGRAWRTV